jgi:branched-chain amino acid aminotransferase
MTQVWLNGLLTPAGEARIDPTDRGFTLGDGIFETARVHQAHCSLLPRHLARLRSSARILGIPLPNDDSEISAATKAVIKANEVIEGSARITLTRGPAARGLASPAVPRPTILITAAGGIPPQTPVRLIRATSIRRQSNALLPKIKSLNYLENILARREAEAQGADDALLLNSNDQIVEATVANFFYVQSGNVLTPAVEDGALPGITRAILIERGAVQIRTPAPGAEAKMDAAFIGNSLGIRAIAEIDARPLTIRSDILAWLRQQAFTGT